MSNREKMAERAAQYQAGVGNPSDYALPDDFLNAIDAAHEQVANANAMVRHTDGTLQFGHFRLTGKGLVSEQGATTEEWLQLGEVLKRIDDSMQWFIGDWFVYAEREWGKTYDDVSEVTGYAQSTLKDLAYVARNVQLSVRTDQLTFTHHKLVAALPENEQKNWLNYAAENKLSISKMRKAMDGTTPLLVDDSPVTARSVGKKLSKIERVASRIGQGRKVSQTHRAEALGYIESIRQMLAIYEREIKKGKK